MSSFPSCLGAHLCRRVVVAPTPPPRQRQLRSQTMRWVQRLAELLCLCPRVVSASQAACARTSLAVWPLQIHSAGDAL